MTLNLMVTLPDLPPAANVSIDPLLRTLNLMVTLPDLPPAANVSTHPLLRACDASTKVWLFRSCNDFKDLPVETVEQFQMLRKWTERAHHELKSSYDRTRLKLKGSVSRPKRFLSAILGTLETPGYQQTVCLMDCLAFVSGLEISSSRTSCLDQKQPT